MTAPNLLDTLEQEEWWYGQDGFPYRVAEMESSHRVNVLNFLRRRADNLWARALWRERRELEDAPEDVMRSWERDAASQVAADPLEWLNSKPLVKSLRYWILLQDSYDVDFEVADERALPRATRELEN